jgi:hypothetical protein
VPLQCPIGEVLREIWLFVHSRIPRAEEGEQVASEPDHASMYTRVGLGFNDEA